MSASDTLTVRLLVTDGIYRFFDLVDNGRASATASLFHPDATLTFGPGSPQPGTISGADIRSAMEARENQRSAFTRHFIGNVIFDRIATSEAEVRYQLILFRSDDETRLAVPAFVADVGEKWILHDGEFKIMSRTILPTFSKA